MKYVKDLDCHINKYTQAHRIPKFSDSTIDLLMSEVKIAYRAALAEFAYRLPQKRLFTYPPDMLKEAKYYNIVQDMWAYYKLLLSCKSDSQTTIFAKPSRPKRLKAQIIFFLTQFQVTALFYYHNLNLRIN